MRTLTHILKALAVVIAVSVTFGCSGSGAQPAPPATSPPASSSTTPAGGATTGAGSVTRAAAIRMLQAYLDSWRTDGLAIANRRYLVPDEQVANGADALVLAAGRVATVRSESPTASGLVLDVDLDLTFRGGTGAWGDGINERFVTFTPREGAVPFVMSLATSP
jgi:hypothetical protein